MLLKMEFPRPIFSILLFFWHQGSCLNTSPPKLMISSVSQCWFVTCLLSAHSKKHTDMESEHKQVNYLILTQTCNCQGKDEHFYHVIGSAKTVGLLVLMD